MVLRLGVYSHGLHPGKDYSISGRNTEKKLKLKMGDRMQELWDDIQYVWAIVSKDIVVIQSRIFWYIFCNKNGPYWVFFIERSVNLEKKFRCLQFFQKTNLEILIFTLACLGRIFLFVFWKNWKQKMSFRIKINWPLGIN